MGGAFPAHIVQCVVVRLVAHAKSPHVLVARRFSQLPLPEHGIKIMRNLRHGATVRAARTVSQNPGTWSDFVVCLSLLLHLLALMLIWFSVLPSVFALHAGQLSRMLQRTRNRSVQHIATKTIHKPHSTQHISCFCILVVVWRRQVSDVCPPLPFATLAGQRNRGAHRFYFDETTRPVSHVVSCVLRASGQPRPQLCQRVSLKLREIDWHSF